MFRILEVAEGHIVVEGKLDMGTLMERWWPTARGRRLPKKSVVLRACYDETTNRTVLDLKVLIMQRKIEDIVRSLERHMRRGLPVDEWILVSMVGERLVRYIMPCIGLDERIGCVVRFDRKRMDMQLLNDASADLLDVLLRECEGSTPKEMAEGYALT